MATPLTPDEVALWQTPEMQARMQAIASPAAFGPPRPDPQHTAERVAASMNSQGLYIPGLATPQSVTEPPTPAISPAPAPPYAATKLTESLNSNGLYIPGMKGVDQSVQDPSLPRPVASTGAIASPAATRSAEPGLGMQLQMPAYAPPRTTPAGWQPSSRSGRLQLTGDEKGTLASSEENYEQANDKRAAVQMQVADDVAALRNAQQVGAERADAEAQQREAERQQYGRENVAKMQALTKDVNDASNIDPGKFWDNKGTLARVVGAIGVALGGFVAGRTGGPNLALDQIERAIDRDVDAQKARLAAARGKLDEQRGIYASMREQFGDERMADAAAKHAYLENAERQVQNLAANSASKDIQARSQELLAGLQEKKFQHAAQLEQMAQGQVTERYAPAQTVGGAPKPQTLDPSRIVRMPDGSVRVMGTADEGKEERGKAGATANIQSNIDEALRIRKDASAIDLANPYSTARKRLDSLQAETSQLVTVARGQGAMSRDDQEVATRAIGEMNGWTDSSDEVLKGTRERFGKQFEREVQARGGERIATGYTLDKSGNVVPVQQYTGQSDKPEGGMVRKVARNPVK